MSMPLARGILAIAVLVTASPGAEGRDREPANPVGVWNCVVYGDTVRGDERVALLLDADGRSFWSVQIGGSISSWRRLGDWSARGSRFTFVDPRTERGFTADLERSSLGGGWRDGGREGGWWCARRPEPVAAVAGSLRRSSPELFIPPLVPDVMASPRYPLEAIREAKEGRAVVCFVVDPTGAVLDPEILELSDPIFEAPTLRAIERSSYRPSSRAELHRPGCRHYAYELTARR